MTADSRSPFAMFDLAPVAVAVVEGPRHVYAYVNALMTRLLGHDDVVGKAVLDAIPELEAQGYGVLFDQVTASGEPFVGDEVPIKLAHHASPEGDFFNFSITPRRSATGEVDGLLIVATDVTQIVVARRRVEALAAVAQASEAELRTITDALPVLISFVTADERYGLANRAYEEWFGVKRDDLIGRRIQDVVGDAAYTALRPNVIRALAGERFGFEQYDVPYRLGGKRDIRVEFVPRRTPSGAVDGYVALLQDITHDRAAERERQRLLAERESLSEAEVTLRHAAEHANRSKDEFLAMLGHELRNPLAPIVTALQLMTLSGNPAFGKERAILERQVEHLSHLVDDLLDISRITSGKVELQREHLEMAAVTARAIEMASPLIEQRQHHLIVAVPEALVVDGDATRLGQVVSNLLTNAAKYTEKGGTIDVRAVRAGDEVVLSVRDTGVGIAPDMLPRVFDLFAQERQEIDRASGGLGLGLAIVRSLVTMHGGTVTAESAGTGRGSTFTVRLPLAAQSAVPVPPAPAPRLPPAASASAALRRRILIVDDNEDAATLLATLLEDDGYEVHVAFDGHAALALVETYAPALAILDIGLPGIDGYELAARLRQRPSLAGARLIALTGYGQPSDRARTAAAGFDAHLVKPVRVAEVRELIASLLA